VSDWSAREAYGRFIPSVTVGTGFSYQASGTPRFGNFSSADVGLSRTPEYFFSDYQIGMALNLSGGTFFRAAQARANQGATEARIEAAAYTLTTNVTRQYLARCGRGLRWRSRGRR
jgi:outer membrane protein TolC